MFRVRLEEFGSKLTGLEVGYLGCSNSGIVYIAYIVYIVIETI